VLWLLNLEIVNLPMIKYPSISIKIVICVIILSMANNIAFARETYTNYKVISVYIFNFLKYTKWPVDKNKIICIADDDKIAETLVSISNKYPFKVVQVQADSDFANCSIAYFSKNSLPLFKTIHPILIKNHILSIGSIDDFILIGGVVGLVDSGEKISFEINLKSAQTAGLIINAEVIDLARRVID
jgi:hypothetical protein